MRKFSNGEMNSELPRDASIVYFFLELVSNDCRNNRKIKATKNYEDLQETMRYYREL